jgi:putative tricarboxylic transport membrane protein
MAWAEILLNVETIFSEHDDENIERFELKSKNIVPTWTDTKQVSGVILRSSVIGVIIGAIPGAGGTIASIVAYAQQKRFSKHPEELGTGAIEGIAAAESANNACTGGAMITMLALGIPVMQSPPYS